MSKTELSVIGYACKIFNDKNAAAEIESSSHLHPHELDLLTTIDRFDVRGLLEFPIDYKRATEKITGDLSASDETEMLRRDRFGDLDSQLDHDDEYRRLQEEIAAENNEENNKSTGKYGSVGFSYGESEPNDESSKPGKPEEEAFVVPEGLILPKNMALPKLQKEHEIILRTAKFLANQNNQMEILLKAKQSGTDKFDFLNFGHTLNDYYKHLKKLIASGDFDPDANESPESQSESDSDSDGGGGLSALNAAAALAASKKIAPVQETSIRPESPVINNIDENHPLFKIISKRKEADKQAQLEREARKKQREIQDKFKSMIQVPPPNICQTVEWVTKELLATEVSEREEKETRLRMQVTLEFMNKGHPFYNYFQTMLQRALLTASTPPSPPGSPKSHENCGDVSIREGPIKFSIKTASSIEERVVAARKKAEEVAKTIVNREMEKISLQTNENKDDVLKNGSSKKETLGDTKSSETSTCLMPKRRRRSRTRSSSRSIRKRSRSRSRSRSRGSRRRRSRSKSRTNRSYRSRSRSRSRERHHRRRRKETREHRSRSSSK